METKVLLIVSVLLAMANVALADMFGTGANQFTISFVDISGNSNPTSGYGIVNNDYRMGTYEITNDQWNKFTNIYGTPTGSPSDAYDANAYWTGTDVPTNEVSWFEAAQFVNYLNTSADYPEAYKFTGTQGAGDYTFAVWESGDVGYDASNPYRNSNAFYFLPTEDEWVKAAYWNGTSLQDYATPDNSLPIEDVEANYSYESDAQPWNVGSGSEELNGTFDMMGNIFEWMESPDHSGNYLSDADRGQRGGSWFDHANLNSSDRGGYISYADGFDVGFRVASIPEPTNHPPVADVGDDQTVYVCIDGIAGVTLDGSDSNDIDGDQLTYYWSWMIDDEIYDANGVVPTIELPIGEHIIELIVNDGIEDSDPNEVVVTVIDSIDLLGILADNVIEFVQYEGTANSLLAKIDKAIGKLEDDNDKNDKAAITSLQAFINAVKAQSGKKIVQQDADDLIETAQQAIDILCSE